MEWFWLAFVSALFSASATILEKKNLFTLDAFLNVDFALISATSLLVLYFKTILGALAFYCVMLAIKNLEISGSLPLLVLTPGLVAWFAFIFLGESLGQFEIIGMILLLSGTYLLEAKSMRDMFLPFKIFYESKFHHYIIFALLLFTTTSILDKVLLKNYHLEPNAFMGFQQLFLAANFFIIVLISKKGAGKLLSTINKKAWLWIIGASLLTIVYRYTQIEAVKVAPVALVLSVKRISVFIAAIGGGKIFNEQNLAKKAIATIIMIAGAILIING